jgi:Spy/CpxP family protein refolding chaperone
MEEISRELVRRRCAVIAPTLLALFMLAGGVETRAQGKDAPSQTPQAQTEVDERSGNAPLGLLRVLNLTPEQREQIGALRRETEPQGRSLGARLRLARRALDEAIYSDHPDDGVIEARVREVAAAQAAVLRLRTLTELKIRRVLSLEQLNSFRRLRSQSRPRQGRMNQTLPPGNLPEVISAERLRNRIQRRRQERQRQQQQPTPDPNAQTLSAPRERRRAPLGNAPPPR